MILYKIREDKLSTYQAIIPNNELISFTVNMAEDIVKTGGIVSANSTQNHLNEIEPNQATAFVKTYELYQNLKNSLRKNII